MTLQGTLEIKRVSCGAMSKTTIYGVLALVTATIGAQAALNPATGVYATVALAAAGACWVVARYLRAVETRAFRKRLITLGALGASMSPAVAMAQVNDMAGLKQALGRGLGMLMWFALFAGCAMMLRGVMMDRSNGEWKWEILKGFFVAAVPTIMNVVFQFFFSGQYLTAQFQ